MADLLLHIGHVKTGSTWLQEGFRLNQAALAAAGIAYPLPRHRDADAEVPAGNAVRLLDDPERAAARIARAARPGGGTTLLSSEVLFTRLTLQHDLGFLPRAAGAAGFERVRLLLFVRAPIPLAASIWQQRIKGWRGETRDLDTFAARSFDMPRRVAGLLDRLDGVEGVELTLRSYDAHRGDLMAAVENWLGMPERSLRRPEHGQINRSLTRTEAALQLALNRVLGPSGDIFAVRLGNRLPGLPPDPPRISESVARALIERDAAALDRIDAMLPPGEALSRAIPKPGEGPLALSEAQMAVIAEGIAARVRPTLRARIERAARGILRRR